MSFSKNYRQNKGNNVIIRLILCKKKNVKHGNTRDFTRIYKCKSRDKNKIRRSIKMLEVNTNVLKVLPQEEIPKVGEVFEARLATDKLQSTRFFIKRIMTIRWSEQGEILIKFVGYQLFKNGKKKLIN